MKDNCGFDILECDGCIMKVKTSVFACLIGNTWVFTRATFFATLVDSDENMHYPYVCQIRFYIFKNVHETNYWKICYIGFSFM